MAQLVILGHKTRSKEVIEILEMLGGKNTHDYACNVPGYAYIINEQGIIGLYIPHPNSPFAIFTLEEFLEKFSYKVGDKVLLSGVVKTIKQVCWNDTENEVIYKLETNVRGFSEEYYVHHYDLKPYKEETTEERENSVVVNIEHEQLKIHSLRFDKTQLVINDKYELKQEGDTYYIIHKQSQYPKTYVECCNIIGAKTDRHYYYNKRDKYEDYPHEVKLLDSLDYLRQLLICRDAYWKIAGEQMGLGKPWVLPFNENQDSKPMYFIVNKLGKIYKDNANIIINNRILAFPTKEMRDAFYENFKELIELCKELL